MIRTFDFIPVLQRFEERRKAIYSMMEQSEDVEYDIHGWHLYFAQKRNVVIVTSNGTDDYLEWKFIPAEISYKSFLEMIESNGKREEGLELKIQFLY